MIAVHTVIPTVFTHYIQLQSILFTCRVSDIVYLHKWCISYISCIQYHMISLEKLPFIPWISHWITKKKPWRSHVSFNVHPMISPSPIPIPSSSRPRATSWAVPWWSTTSREDVSPAASSRRRWELGKRWGKTVKTGVHHEKNDDLTVEFWDSVGYIMEYPLII